TWKVTIAPLTGGILESHLLRRWSFTIYIAAFSYGDISCANPVCPPNVMHGKKIRALFFATTSPS
ncbi:hypothetical protein, partial [Enterobacter cloacae]